MSSLAAKYPSSQITKEREKYLREEFKELTDKQKKAVAKLKELNKKRSKILSVLKEKDTFVKYKKYQEDLIKIENEIFSYQQKLEGAKTIENYEKSIEETRSNIREIATLIKIEIDKSNKNYQEIKRLFQDIYKTTFEYTALLVVEPNNAGNVNFETTILNKSYDLTGQGDGYTSTKILCASFVLSILIHYSSKSYFKFAYHDGILESWGDNQKISFINLIGDYCKQYDIQYIVSLIKSDIPQNFSFQSGEIIRTLGKDDKLFGIEF